MKRTLILMLCLLTLAACSNTPRQKTVQELIADYVMTQQDPTLKSFVVTRLALYNEVTLGNELLRKERTFRKKAEIAEEKYKDYRRRWMQENARIQKATLDSTEAILERLRDYRTEHEASLDSVIYRVYTFDCKGSNKLSISGCYAVISSEGVVLAVSNPGGNPTQGLSYTMPGYREDVLLRENN